MPAPHRTSLVASAQSLVYGPHFNLETHFNLGPRPLLLWTQAWVRSRPQPESAQVLGKGSQLASRGLGVSRHGPGEPGSLISVRSLSPLQGHRERKGHHLDRALGTHALRIGLPQP